MKKYLAVLVAGVLGAGCLDGGTDQSVGLSLKGDAQPATPRFGLRWVRAEAYMNPDVGNYYLEEIPTADDGSGSYEMGLSAPAIEAMAPYEGHTRAVANIVVLDETGAIVGGALGAILLHVAPTEDGVAWEDFELASRIDGVLQDGYNLIEATCGDPTMGDWHFGKVLDLGVALDVWTEPGFWPDDLPHAESLVN